ncbi:MAG: DUF222 domain-containing protein [Pseudonocardiaceae bacterium]
MRRLGRGVRGALHAGNVLAVQREPWLVIDPKPYVGDPAYDPLQHLLNCARLAADLAGLARRMADLLGLDSHRMISWLFARCVQESLDYPALRDVALANEQERWGSRWPGFVRGGCENRGVTAAISDPVQVISSCLENVRGGLRGLHDDEIVHALRQIEELSRTAHSVMLDVVAETEARGIAGRTGFGTTSRMLSAMLRVSAAEALTRTEHAAMVGSRRAMTGETLPPRLPATAAALAEGQIGTGQLRVITETMVLIPTSVPEPARERVEADLAGHARDFDPRRLRIIAQRMLDVLDPDGPEPAEDPALVDLARGELWLKDRRDGRLGLEGWLDPEHGSMVRALIEQLAARRPVTDDVPDDRSVPQRQADALIELCERARAADEFPSTAGEPPHLTVTIDWDALRTGLGTATLDYGQLISADVARRLACDGKLIPVVLGGDSEPLDVGRAMRTVPLGIRRALVARDRGCSFPGCNRPPRVCDAHHARHWADGGETSVHNCCLLCTMHHQQVHLQGWDITIQGGRVEFRPPAIIDPDRRPLTNPLRH